MTEESSSPAADAAEETRAAPKGEGWWGDASALPTVFRKAVEIEA